MPLEREREPSRRGRVALLLFLLAVALLGLVVLRAYRARQLDTLVTEVPLLRADPSPTRERPADPGGMEVPHRDKLIFQSLEERPPEPVVERLLPPPEEPLPRPEALTEAALPESAAPAPQPAAAPERPDAVAVPEPPASPDEAEAPAALAPPDLVSSAAAPPAPPTEADTTAALEPAPPNPAQGFRVQIGAFSSPEEAARGWLEAMALAPELLGALRHFVARADLGERGVFHRLQVGPLPSADGARGLCARLKESGVDCFVVAP